MLPLFFSLFDLHNMGEASALNFEEVESLIGEDFDPEFVVFKGKVKDEASGMSQILFKLIVEQI